MSFRPLPIIQFDPHSGLEAPPEVRDRLRIDERDIVNDADLWADHHYDFSHPDLASLIPPGYGPGTLCTISTPIARVLVDANRYPDDHVNGNAANPDGPVKCQTSYGKPIYREPLSPAIRALLLERYYQGYHQRVAAALEEHAGRAKLLLDCHSMAQHGPDAYRDPGKARPLLCISNVGDPEGNPLADVGATSCSARLLRRTGEIAAALFQDMELLEPDPNQAIEIVALNQPFRGGYVLRNYSRIGNRSMSVPGMMIEVNRGLFVGDQRANRAAFLPDAARLADVRRRLYQLMIEVVELLDSDLP